MTPSLSLKQRLGGNASLLGGFVFSPDPAVTEIYGKAGFDFVIVDMEHALNDLHTVAGHLRAAAAVGIHALVRLGASTLSDAPRLLDAGAEGVVLPHFGTPGGGAQKAVEALRYFPKGVRPACTGVAAAGYGLGDFARAAEAANRDVLSLALIEDRECLDCLPELFAQYRPDWLMPGPSDLAVSLGVPGQLRHTRVTDAVDAVFSAAAAADIPVGMYVGAPEEIEPWKAKGARFFVYSIDYKLLARTLSDGATACRMRMAASKAEPGQ
jgi:2-keto-3-deoxy-L-rhamnonate aldolase RhmA